MAKKQTIILTHGSNEPKNVVINKGEVLVQHAEFAKDAALWTVLDDGTTKVSFPSKDYVDAISETITGTDGINKKIEGLDGRLGTAEGEIDALQAADTTIRGEFAAADTAIRGDFAAADTALKAELNGKIDTKADSTTVNGINERLTTAEGEIDALQAADTTIRGEFAAEDEAIRGEFAAEDEAIRGEFTAADTALETAYKDADTVLEGKITAEATARENADTQIRTDFAAADNTVRGEFAAADDVVRGEFTAADTALKNELNGKIDTKADTTIVNGIDERLTKLIGNDADKSVRAIANEEVDTFKNLLYGEGTADVIDTLQDVINWIDSDESGATKIVADIAELQKVTSGYEGEKAIQNAVNGIDERLTTAEGEIDALQAADTTIRGEFAAADDVVRGEFTAADTALKNELNGEIAKKADSTTVNGINDRLTTAEGEIDDLQAADTQIRTDLQAADTQIRTDFAAADTALKNELTAEINKKADSTTVTGINTRLEAVEGAYIKSVDIIDDDDSIGVSVESNTLTLNFNSMVIDGGEY